MGVFYQEEQPRQSKRCKFLATVLKEAFSNCHTSSERFANSGPEEEYPTSDIDDESEVLQLITLYFTDFFFSSAAVIVFVMLCYR